MALETGKPFITNQSCAKLSQGHNQEMAASHASQTNMQLHHKTGRSKKNSFPRPIGYNPLSVHMPKTAVP